MNLITIKIDIMTESLYDKINYYRCSFSKSLYDIILITDMKFDNYNTCTLIELFDIMNNYDYWINLSLSCLISSANIKKGLSIMNQSSLDQLQLIEGNKKETLDKILITGPYNYYYIPSQAIIDTLDYHNFKPSIFRTSSIKQLGNFNDQEYLEYKFSTILKTNGGIKGIICKN